MAPPTPCFPLLLPLTRRAVPLSFLPSPLSHPLSTAASDWVQSTLSTLSAPLHSCPSPLWIPTIPPSPLLSSPARMPRRAGRRSAPCTGTTSRPSCIGSRCSNPVRSRNETAAGRHRLVATAAMAQKARVVRGWVGTRLRYYSRVVFWLPNAICVISGLDGSLCWSAMIVVFGSFFFLLLICLSTILILFITGPTSSAESSHRGTVDCALRVARPAPVNTRRH